MKISHLILMVSMGMFCACNSWPLSTEYSPGAGARQARRDYAAGAPKIYLAGGYAACEPGVPADQRALVARLPRDGRLAGCTNPNAEYSMGYATAYNQEIVSLLQRGPVH